MEIFSAKLLKNYLEPETLDSLKFMVLHRYFWVSNVVLNFYLCDIWESMCLKHQCLQFLETIFFILCMPSSP